jgi:hypothetical protein
MRNNRTDSKITKEKQEWNDYEFTAYVSSFLLKCIADNQSQ